MPVFCEGCTDEKFSSGVEIFLSMVLNLRDQKNGKDKKFKHEGKEGNSIPFVYVNPKGVVIQGPSKNKVSLSNYVDNFLWKAKEQGMDSEILLFSIRDILGHAFLPDQTKLFETKIDEVANEQALVVNLCDGCTRVDDVEFVRIVFGNNDLLSLFMGPSAKKKQDQEAKKKKQEARKKKQKERKRRESLRKKFALQSVKLIMTSTQHLDSILNYTSKPLIYFSALNFFRNVNRVLPLPTFSDSGGREIVKFFANPVWLDDQTTHPDTGIEGYLPQQAFQKFIRKVRKVGKAYCRFVVRFAINPSPNSNKVGVEYTIDKKGNFHFILSFRTDEKINSTSIEKVADIVASVIKNDEKLRLLHTVMAVKIKGFTDKQTCTFFARLMKQGIDVDISQLIKDQEYKPVWRELIDARQKYENEFGEGLDDSDIARADYGDEQKEDQEDQEDPENPEKRKNPPQHQKKLL